MANLADALRIVESAFGDHFIVARPRSVEFGAFVADIEFYVEACDLDLYEPSVAFELDRIEWQLVPFHYLNSNRIKHTAPINEQTKVNHAANIFLLFPIMRVVPPDIVFHSTPTRTAEKCRREGIRASRGNTFYNTQGKIHVCPNLLGQEGSADEMTTLLSVRHALHREDYSILEVRTGELPVRAHLDVFCDSGTAIILDRIEVIPSQFISNEFRLVNGKWKPTMHSGN